jgi:hypothetical protein
MAKPRPAEHVGMPAYAWDRRAHNYRNLDSGKFVSRPQIQSLLSDAMDRARSTQVALTDSHMNGRLTSRQWYEATRRELRHAYNASVALASGGWDRVAKGEFQRNGALLREEYKRLSRFGAQIAAGQVSPAQAAARIQLYSDSAYSRFYQVEQEQKMADGKTKEELWVTVGDEATCDICSGLASRGWQPIGTMPNPGDPHPGCRCSKEYRE